VTRRTLFRLLVAFTLVWIGWAGWSMIGRTHPYELRVLDDLGAPIASAVIDSNGSQLGTTGSDGRVDLVWGRSTKLLEVSAAGHVPRRVTLNDVPEDHFDVVLKARLLRGRVVDPDGDGIDGALIDAGSGHAISDGEGYFQIRGAEEGTVTVDRPAWVSTSFEWDGSSGDSVVTIEPFGARAVHVGGVEVRDDFAGYVQMATETELNALMIDLKDESGRVFFNTTNVTANDVGAAAGAFDLGSLVRQTHELGLYLIGRIVLFNDPIAALGAPDMAVWDTDTNAPYETGGQRFLDPTDPEARRYGLDLAIEACEAGVDEIQFDYVRFPDSRRESARFDGGVGPEVRVSTISSFLTQAADSLRPLGCAVAADIFGYLTTAPDDGGIGQRWEEVAAIVDVISPMLYPSQYDSGWWGLSDPSQHPGEIVQRALADGLERINGDVVVRPWLQDFGYTAAEVRAQIAAVEEQGLGWMLWNNASEVTVDALQPAE
jgi:hypothetical protein